MKQHLPGLDGVRGIAVSMVLLGHAAHFPEFPAAVRALMVVDVAHLGVVVFFVLSGFLITTLLVDERALAGRVSLRDFYVRRTLRIFPAAFLYLAVVAAAALAHRVTLLPGDLAHAATYTMNYHHERAWTLGHLWSLAVEEQFYLLWPALFLLAGRRALWVGVGAVCLAPLARSLAWVLLPDARAGIDEEFQFVCDSLSTGCLLALLAEHVGTERLVALVPGWLYAVAPLAALLAASFSTWPSFYLPVGTTVVNVGVAITLLWIVGHPAARAMRVLDSRALVALGALSYSLYLWQQFFLDPEKLAIPHALAIGLALCGAAAAASYFLVERPLCRLRGKYRHAPAPPAPDAATDGATPIADIASAQPGLARANER